MVRLWLDSMIFEVFSNLSDSMILMLLLSVMVNLFWYTWEKIAFQEVEQIIMSEITHPVQDNWGIRSSQHEFVKGR